MGVWLRLLLRLEPNLGKIANQRYFSRDIDESKDSSEFIRKTTSLVVA